MVIRGRGEVIIRGQEKATSREREKERKDKRGRWRGHRDREERQVHRT